MIDNESQWAIILNHARGASMSRGNQSSLSFSSEEERLYGLVSVATRTFNFFFFIVMILFMSQVLNLI